MKRGEESISEFRRELKDLDLDVFEEQLDRFSKEFETVLSRGQLNNQPSQVRNLVEKVKDGLSKMMEEKDSVVLVIESSTSMSDPEIWRVIQRFPFLSTWTISYTQLMALVVEIEKDLEGQVTGRAPLDVKQFRKALEECLAGVDAIIGGERNVK